MSGGSGTIHVTQQTVDTHRNAISGHTSSFEVTISTVDGGNASGVTDANIAGTSSGSIAGRYATALPNSATDIQRIADVLGVVDSTIGDGISSGGGGSGIMPPMSATR